MTVSVSFQQNFTWRKLGYLYFTNSLDYRSVLEQNSQWRVTELPPIGAQLLISPDSNSLGTPGGLTQGSFITNSTTSAQSDAIYPFDSEESYTKALYRYNLQGVVERESLNGITFDSEQAVTGIQ